MPTANQMVPELQAARSALLKKLKANKGNADESQFIYHTVRQIEKLQTVNDLTAAEAQVLTRGRRSHYAALRSH